jgi:3'-5' exoribonuclease
MKMTAEEILKLSSNSVVEGTFLLNDPKLIPFNLKGGHFFSFNLSDKTGMVWAKIWDNAEHIAQQLKEQDVQIVTIKGMTNLYNNKLQVIVEKIKKADSYDIKDIIKISGNDPEFMWNELTSIMETLSNSDCKKIWEYYLKSPSFLEKFKKWPGGKGIVHHAYQHGLLEHTLSVIKIVRSFQTQPIDMDKALLGAFLHDLGKLDAYDFRVAITMTNIGRLHEHTVLSYFNFRQIVESLGFQGSTQLIEDIGHIILSHHGTREHHAVINPMTIEAKLVSFADLLDSDSNYMTQQLEHNSDEQGWIFDTLNEQFYFRRPQQQMKRRKIISEAK